MTLVIDEKNPENNCLKIKFKGNAAVEETYVTVGDNGSPKATGKASQPTKVSSESGKDKADSKAKSLLNKGKSLFKKK